MLGWEEGKPFPREAVAVIRRDRVTREFIIDPVRGQIVSVTGVPDPGEGLPAWTSRNRNVDDGESVLSSTTGCHHVPSSEDWPVYNLGWNSVSLRPYNFFDQNPAMDLPPAE